MKIFVLFGLGLLSLASATKDSNVEHKAPVQQPDPERSIENDYRVLFRDGHTLDDHFSHIGQNLSQQADSRFRWIRVINGYSALLDQQQIDQVRRDPGVNLIEQNAHIEPQNHMDSEEKPFKLVKKEPSKSKRWTETYLSNIGWWLKMTNAGQKVPLSNQPYGDTFYSERGEGVNVYVMDTGVRITHEIFNGRASNFNDDPTSPYTGGSWDDEKGHGTHVAGIVAQNAPAANIINVNVLGNGPAASGSGIITAVDDIVQNYEDNLDNDDIRGAIINMSFKTSDSQSFRDAIAWAIRDGIAVVTSAGNDGRPKGSIPCGFPDTICVAACDISYNRPSWSNYAENINIIAPGDYIISAWNEGDDLYIDNRGTSMAAPGVSGILAQYAGYEKIKQNASQIYQRMNDNLVSDACSGFDNTPNSLVNTGFNNHIRAPWTPYYIQGSETQGKLNVVNAVNGSASPSFSEALEVGPTATSTDADPALSAEATDTDLAEPSVSIPSTMPPGTDIPPITTVPPRAKREVAITRHKASIPQAAMNTPSGMTTLRKTNEGA